MPPCRTPFKALSRDIAKNSLRLPEVTKRPPYRNTFTAVRRHLPVVSAFSRSANQKPTAGDLTTTTIVGPAGNGKDWKSVNSEYASNLEIFYKEYATSK